MANAAGTLRLTFNTSDARETAPNRFVSTFAGAGVQHIALAAPNVAVAVEHAAAAGMPLLSIPPNYYEDVAARIDLDDATLAAGERLGLLFDRDAGGEFRHAYTDTFQHRFFFELVQRDGYAGFGAANAPVRVAAPF